MLDQVDVGALDDDGSGDTLREAFTKTNANFEQLITMLALRVAGRVQQSASNWPGEFVPRHLSDQAPRETPPLLGAIWLNTQTGEAFISTGTASPSDWKKITLTEV